jgi:hypothetical protein
MLNEKLNSLIAEAMKEHNQERTEVLRLIKAEFVKAEKDGMKLNDANEIKLLTKMVVQRQDSIEQYKAANRTDLVDNEQKEIDIIREFIPSMPSDEEIEKLTDKIVSNFKRDNGSVSMKDTRQIIAWVNETYNTPSVGKIVSTVIKRYV